MRFPSAAKHDPAIDLWLSSQRAELRPLVESAFSSIRACGKDVRELMHDGRPTACVGDAAFAYVGAYSHHVGIGFFFGAMLDDPDYLLQGTGKRGRHVKLRPATGVDLLAITQLIRAAYIDIKSRLLIKRA